jgi:hypothetical protein
MALTKGTAILAADGTAVVTAVNNARTRVGQAADTTAAVANQKVMSALFLSIKNNLTAANANAYVNPKADLSTLINFEAGKLIYPAIFSAAQTAATAIYNNYCSCNCNDCDCDCDRCACTCDRCACDCDCCTCT